MAPLQRAQSYAKVLKKAKTRYTKFHNLRHTFASQLLSNGANILYVSQQLGHADASITLKVYAKWIPTTGQRQAMNTLPYVGGTFSNALEISQAVVKADHGSDLEEERLAG